MIPEMTTIDPFEEHRLQSDPLFPSHAKVVDVFPFKTMKPTATKLTPMMMPRWATHAPGQSKKLLAAGSLPQLTNQFC